MKLCPCMGQNINLYDRENTAKTTAHIRKISIALFFINIRPFILVHRNFSEGVKAQRDAKSTKKKIKKVWGVAIYGMWKTFNK